MRYVRCQSAAAEVSRIFVLDEVTQRVAVGPGTAQQLANPFRPAQAPFAPSAVSGECLIVPANGPANLVVCSIDAARGVMCRRNPAGDPVGQTTGRLQLAGNPAHARAGLAFQLHQAQLANRVAGRLAVPQIGGKPHLGDGLPVHSKGQTFETSSAEVPTDDNAFSRDKSKWLAHGHSLKMSGTRSERFAGHLVPPSPST